MDFDMYRLLDRQALTSATAELGGEAGGQSQAGQSQAGQSQASKVSASPSPETDPDRADGISGDSTPSETAEKQYITFNDQLAFGQIESRIFSADSQQIYKMSYLLMDKSLFVNKATWRVANVTEGTVWTDIASLDYEEDKSKVNDFMSDTGSSIILTISQLLNYPHTEKRGHEMVLVLDWTLDDKIGNTTSRAFSVTNGTAQEQDEAIANLQNSAYAKKQTQVVESPLFDPKNSTPIPSHLTLSPSPSESGNSSRGNLDGTPNDGDAAGGGAGEGGGGGGLSTGAIAGIAVGVGILALVILGAAIFFCIRRRRRRNADADAAQQNKMSSYMVAGKETSPIALDSPSSPYQDDHFPPPQQHHLQQQQQQQQLQQVPPRVPVPTAAAAAAAGERRHSRNESDAARSPTPGSGRETPQHGVSRHLVEDGMTTEEIHRLEEEERQLDDEIERAGRR